MSRTLNLGTLLTRLALDDRMSKALRNAEDALHRVERTAMRVAKVAGVAFAGLTGVVSKAIHSFDALERAMDRLRSAAARHDAFDLERAAAFAEHMQMVTRTTDDQVLSAQALGLSFDLTQSQIEATTRAAVDLSQATGVKLDRAMLMLTRSLDGTTSRLERYGVVLTEAEQAAFDNATESQRLAMILEAVERAHGGAAAGGAQAALSLSNLTAQTSNLWEEFGRVVDQPVARVLNTITGAVQGLLSWWSGLSAEARQWIGIATVVVGGIAGITAAIAGLIAIAAKVAPVVIAAFSPMLTIAVPIAVILAGIVLIIGAIRQAWREWGDDIMSWVGDRLESVRDTIADIKRHIEVEREEAAIRSVREAVQGLEGDTSAAADAMERLLQPTHAGGGRLGVAGAVPEVRGADMQARVQQAADELRSGAIDVAEAIDRVRGVGVETQDQVEQAVGESESAIVGFLKQSGQDIKNTFLEGLDFLGGLLPEINIPDLPELGDLKGEMQKATAAAQAEAAARAEAEAAASRLAQAQSRLAEITGQIEDLERPATEVGRLRRQWGEMAIELAMAGAAAGEDVSGGLERLAGHFGAEIEDAQTSAARELSISMAVIREEIGREEASLLREWDRTVAHIESLGKEMELPPERIAEMLGEVESHYAEALEGAAEAASRLTELAREIGDRAIRETGMAGRLVGAGIEGAQTGGKIGAIVNVLVELLSASEGFARIVAVLNQVLQEVADFVGSVFVGLAPVFGAIAILLRSIFQPLEPLFRLVGEIVSQLAPVLVAVGALLQAILTPVVALLQTLLAINPIMVALELAFRLVFEVVRLLSLGVLYVVYAIQSAYNWMLEGIAQFLESISRRLLGGIADKIRDLQSDADSTMEEIDRLRDMDYDTAMSAAEAASSLDDCADAAAATAEALYNVPRGFRIARARWEAMDPVIGASFFQQAVAATPMATGGIVTAPTLALIGEAGPEAVVPLDKAESFGGDTIHLHVHPGANESDERFARRIARVLENRRARRAYLHTGTRLPTAGPFLGGD